MATTPTTAPICRPSDDLTARTVTDLQSLLTTTDTLRQAMLVSLGLSANKASDISYVTDEKVCAKALTAYNGYRQTPNAPRQIYVFKFGSSYLVEDPTVGQDSEYRGLPIFDRRWVPTNRVYLSF